MEEAMNQGTIRVLLIGETKNGSSYLGGQLESRGCRCWFARSTVEGVALLAQQSFHLILSTAPLHRGDPLLAELGDAKCTVFYSYPVEDGCWWVPVLHGGQKCLGAPALRPSEFIGELDRMVKEIQWELEEAAAATEPQAIQP
jgi:hypothetical protein